MIPGLLFIIKILKFNTPIPKHIRLPILRFMSKICRCRQTVGLRMAKASMIHVLRVIRSLKSKSGRISGIQHTHLLLMRNINGIVQTTLPVCLLLMNAGITLAVEEIRPGVLNGMKLITGAVHLQPGQNIVRYSHCIWKEKDMPPLLYIP